MAGLTLSRISLLHATSALLVVSGCDKQPVICAEYLECLADYDSSEAAIAGLMYGEDGSCWEDEEVATYCRAACRDQIEMFWRDDPFNDACAAGGPSSSKDALGEYGLWYFDKVTCEEWFEQTSPEMKWDIHGAKTMAFTIDATVTSQTSSDTYVMECELDGVRMGCAEEGGAFTFDAEFDVRFQDVNVDWAGTLDGEAFVCSMTGESSS
jgi:hypothetical protein